jgi:endonuclease III related protein
MAALRMAPETATGACPQHRTWTHPGKVSRLKTMAERSPEEKILSLYWTLVEAWGCQHWWPAGSRCEVIVGAYLTQNTSWRNVELAIARRCAERVLSVSGIRRIPLGRLERRIRSSGYFRQKAARRKAFVELLDHRYRGSIRKMFIRPSEALRAELLSLPGVGPETADSILLYAGGHAVFVVDARRIASRHGILAKRAGYEEYRQRFERALKRARELSSLSAGSLSRALASHTPSPRRRARRSRAAEAFSEMHGLIVGVGKQYGLKSQAHCGRCPLGPLLEEPWTARDRSL